MGFELRFTDICDLNVRNRTPAVKRLPTGPLVLGTLLDAAVVGLRRLDSIPTAGLPRMADFARWVIACEPGLGWQEGRFLRAYESNQLSNERVQLALDGLATALIGLVEATTPEAHLRRMGSTSEETQRSFWNNDFFAMAGPRNLEPQG
jgi:hypothetical protein